MAAFDFVARVAHEDLVTQQVLPAQALGAYGFDFLQPVPGEAQRLFPEFGRQEIRQLVVVARVTLEGRAQRVELQRFFPVLLVQRVELAGLVLRRLHRHCGG